MFLREELEALAEKHSNFKLWYTLVEPPADWTYSKVYTHTFVTLL
jgi:NAD(P)H-flavin reductase